MSIPPSKTFAVLVGINDYNSRPKSDGLLDLSGCINDVIAFRNCLIETRSVPANNISTLTSPPLQPSSSSKPATKANFIELVHQVAQHALSTGPNSLIIIYYSGHGGRSHTRYPDKKGKNTYDECLCTLGEDFVDVDFASMLKDLTDKGLAVLVLLDSCHSGGADRDARPGDEKSHIKCAQREEQPDWAAPAAPAEFKDEEGLRNAKATPSWFSTSRVHNLIAACQATETAKESPGDDGGYRGFFTKWLIKALQDLQPSKEPVTYGILTDHLQALCLKVANKQQPMHLGDTHRVLFGNQAVGKAVPEGLQPGITEVDHEKNTVTLNKGTAHGLGPGDIYLLFPPEQGHFGVLGAEAQHSARAQVFEVHGLAAKAAILDDPSGGHDAPPVAVGWFARLKQRANLPVIQLEQKSNRSDEAVKNLKSAWGKLTSGSVGPTVNLVFPSTPVPAQAPIIRLEVSDDPSIRFLTGKGVALEHVPSFPLSDPILASKLAYLLPHLSSYIRLAGLSPQSSVPKPAYDITIQRTQSPDPNNRAPQYNITFQNKSKVALYITILNLNPAYGVDQIVPSQDGTSQEVSINEPFEYPFSISVPKLLEDASKQVANFRMRDLFKIIVTTQQAGVQNYIQPELQGWSPPDTKQGVKESAKRRNAVAVVSGADDFWTELKEVVTTKADLMGEH